MNFQKDLIDCCQTNEISQHGELSKKFQTKINKNKFNAAVCKLIANNLNKDKPKDGFRKKHYTCEMITSQQMNEYLAQQYEDKTTLKDRLIKDLFSIVIEEVIEDLQNKRVTKPVYKLVQDLPEYEIYDLSFDIIEGPANLQFENLLVDKIIYTPSAEEIEVKKNSLLSSTYKDEITDENHLISADDEVVMDFDGKLVFCKKRVSFKGGCAKDYQVKLGAGKMLPDFEKNLIGKKINEKIVFQIKFPEKYSPGLSGETAEFTVSVKKVIKNVPFGDVETYMKKNNIETQEKFEEQIKNALESEIKNQINLIEKDQLFEKLDEYYKDMYIPQSLLDEEFTISKKNYENKKAKEVKSADKEEKSTTENETQESEKDLSDEELMEIVKTKVRLMILFMSTAEAYSISPNQSDLFAEILVQAQMSGIDVMEVMNYFRGNQQAAEYLQKTAAEKKIIAFILSKANRNEINLSREKIEELYKKTLED